MACYHGAASTCRGKSLVLFGAGLGISVSQTRASHNKRDGFGRERATFGDERISHASYCFQKTSSVNIEQQECCVQFWNFSGFVWTFYALTEFSMHLCAQFKFELHARAPVHINWLKIKSVSLGACLGPMQETGMNSNTQPPSLGRKHGDTSFLNSSKSKARLKYMKLGMLPWSGNNMLW